MAKLYLRAAEVAGRRGDERREFAAWSNAGLALQLDNHFEEAADLFLRLRKRDPENPYWSWRAGLNVANQTRWADAVPLYEETIRLLDAGRGEAAQRPEMLLVHVRLANCRRMLAAGETSPARRGALLEKAREGFARYVELAPKDSRGHYWMGVLLHEEMDRPYEALRHFQRAHALDPVCDASLRNLAQIHARYPPPPGTTQEAWDSKGLLYEREVAENADARLAERARRARGPRKDDGCE
jgi:tetratricopeptide (TPR) repeat protein